MRRILLSFLVFGIGFYQHQNACAQGILQTEWVIKQTSTVTNGDAEAWGIDVDEQGNLYWASSEYRPVFGALFDVVVRKLDAVGTLLWPAPAILGGVNNQQAYITTFAEGRVYVGGRDCVANGCDLFLLAIDAASGDTLWTTRWDQSGGYDEADGIIVGNEGIFVTGWTTGATTRQDVVVLLCDRSGTILWVKTWGGEWGDHADGHAVGDNSAVYVTGLFGGTGIFNGFDGQALLAKFSRADGSLIDSVTFGRKDPWMNMENALGMASDGEFLYIIGATTVAVNNWDVFIAKFDRNLKRIWYTTWGGDKEEAGRAIDLDSDGNIYVGVNTKSYGAGEIDISLLKIAPDGRVRAFRTWGGAGDDNVSDVVIDGRFLYLTGVTKSFNPNGNKESILMKVSLDSLTTVAQHAPVAGQFSLEQNYPNPAVTHTMIRFSIGYAAPVCLTLHDALGRTLRTLVREEREPGIHSIPLQIDDLRPGVYFFRLRSHGVVQTRAMVVDF